MSHSEKIRSAESTAFAVEGRAVTEICAT